MLTYVVGAVIAVVIVVAAAAAVVEEEEVAAVAVRVTVTVTVSCGFHEEEGANINPLWTPKMVSHILTCLVEVSMVEGVKKDPGGFGKRGIPGTRLGIPVVTMILFWYLFGVPVYTGNYSMLLKEGCNRQAPSLNLKP